MLWNSMVHCHIHKSLRLVPILSQISPYLRILSHARSILMLSTHLHLCVLSGLFLSAVLTNILHSLLFIPIYSTCPAHLIFFDMVILIILDLDYNLWSSSLCSFSTTPCHFISVPSKYSPHNPVCLLNISCYMFLGQSERVQEREVPSVRFHP
jgi:hypothetical protein